MPRGRQGLTVQAELQSGPPVQEGRQGGLLAQEGLPATWESRAQEEQQAGPRETWESPGREEPQAQEGRREAPQEREELGSVPRALAGPQESWEPQEGESQLKGYRESVPWAARLGKRRSG